jgi:hypothetical protein
MCVKKKPIEIPENTFFGTVKKHICGEMVNDDLKSTSDRDMT